MVLLITGLRWVALGTHICTHKVSDDRGVYNNFESIYQVDRQECDMMPSTMYKIGPCLAFN